MIGLERTRDKVARWVLALALVSAVHGGSVAWVLRSPALDDDESRAGGAFIIELSAVTAAPDDDRSDVAVGARSNEVPLVQESAPVVNTSGDPQPDELPPVPEVKDTPPEDAIAKRPEDKPPEELKPPETSANEAKNAPLFVPPPPSEAKAPQKIENATKTSESPTGQNAGLSQVDRKAIENWFRDLAVHMNRHKQYPSKARESGQRGGVSVSFVMDREGRVVRVSIAKSSGSDVLDQATLELLNRASPLPAPPVSMPGETIALTVPVMYRWKD